ncbi:CheR family methyltransferase [Spirosoma sp. SC4-14]|uniref:CheR family methyltransferase n=1 Tax=Spirosoma sp. SC4-14 TaxID=3128900 RepID=UPI0030CB9265
MSKKKIKNKNDHADSAPLMVGIGASAGGVEALMSFFEQVPADSGMAYIVILHLSPNYDSQLAHILQSVANIPVIQVNEKQPIVPNQVYVISPNRHLQMADGSLLALPNQRLEERRAPVDIFFRTLADAQGSHAIAVILSGSGANGSMGIKRIKENGGGVFVQNPYEAAFNEMPRNAIATELVDDVLPVAQIPARLMAYRQKLKTIDIPEEVGQRPQDQQQALREVFAQLRLRTGHDFSNYKRPTLLRRLERRISVRNLADLPAYAAFLHEHPEETQALLKDLLISVTNFFRDSQVFITLESMLKTGLLQDKKTDDSLRIWVAGCATGEEAYSLAMLCVELIPGMIEAPKIQIFATDIDEAAIATAREGLYTFNDIADVSPERLRRFFTQEGESYRIGSEIREMVLFAHHNVLKDPPFSRLDLISCRNLLIYFNPTAQERVLETFHFALKPGGYLLLGLSETVDGANDLYVTVNREQHLYQSRPVVSRPYPVPESVPRFAPEIKRAPQVLVETSGQQSSRINYGDLHQQLLEQYAPPSIIVNDQYDILHVSERAGRYLHIAGGELSNNLLKLVRPELRLELRTAFYQAIQRQTNVQVPPLNLNLEGKTETVVLLVRPVLRPEDPARGYFLVLFDTVSLGDAQPDSIISSVEPVARQLEEELIRVKAQLAASNSHHELQAEELKASNEELQAMNEELRSAAEELETSKEELQSINEELTTVNQELKVKVEEVSLSSNNLRNLINSTKIATLFLDRGFRVNLFTPAAGEIFNLILSDYGRPLTDITHRLKDSHLLEDAEEVLDKLHPIEREVSTTDGRSFIMHVLPYRTAEDRINGVVVTFVDISRRRETEENLRQSEEQFRLFVTTSSDSLYKMSPDWTVMYQLKGMSFLADTEYPNRSWLEQYIPSEDQAAVQETIRQAINGKKPFEFEHRVIRRDGNIGWTFSRAVPLLNKQQEVVEWFGAATDITDRKQAEATIKESDQRKDEFLALLAHELRNPISTLSNALMLLEETGGVDEQFPLDVVRSIMSREVAHLVRLVDDLLDISRISRGKIELRCQRLNLTEFVAEVASTVRPLVEKAHHQFKVHLPSEPLYVMGDADRLTQVLRNLVDNAIKFTLSEGVIELSLERIGDEALLHIVDNGIGIDEIGLNQIFTMFTQLDMSHTRPQNGLGLGLALVRELVRLHGGRVDVRSKGLEKGSEFIVRLPLATK